MTKNNDQQSTQPDFRILRHYEELGKTTSAFVGAIWAKENNTYSIVIPTLDERIVLYAFEIKERRENGPTHELVRYYESGNNAPRAMIGCLFTKENGNLSIRLDRLSTPVWLTALPVTQSDAFAQAA